MRELARRAEPARSAARRSPRSCYTPGVRLVGALPAEFELATSTRPRRAMRAADPMLARRFVELLAGPASRHVREQGGFEFDPPTANPPPSSGA